jgi:hypothetical protein
MRELKRAVEIFRDSWSKRSVLGGRGNGAIETGVVVSSHNETARASARDDRHEVELYEKP